MPAKLLAFAVSSLHCGVAGALYAFCYLGSVEPDGFFPDLSFRILFMIIIGGVGSILGSFLGAAFILLMPIFPDLTLPPAAALLGLPFSSATVSHVQILLFGILIMFFLVVRPTASPGCGRLRRRNCESGRFPTECLDWTY